jgi:6-phosphogluconate dehydrogenase
MNNSTHFAIIGLGKMGGNMARRLRQQGMKLAVLDQDAQLTQAVAQETASIALKDLADTAKQLAKPRIVWLMLPSGEITEKAIATLHGVLDKGDVIVDGANSNYHDSQRRALSTEALGLHFLDAGVSGGIHGLANGYCLMVGGSKAAFAHIKPYIQSLAKDDSTGWLHTGPAGSGHYTKMVHNGIEYGMMAALAEGLTLMQAKKEFDFDLAEVTELWRHGSVVRSWLLDLTATALRSDQKLDSIAPLVPDSGEGRWTAVESVDLGVPTPVMTSALMSRFSSQGKADYTSKLLAKMRQGFGGHAVASK